MTAFYSFKKIVSGAAPGLLLYVAGTILWLITGGLASFASLPIMMLGSCFILFGTMTRDNLSKAEKYTAMIIFVIVITSMFWGMYF